MSESNNIGISAKRLNRISTLAQHWITPDLHQCVVMHAMHNGKVIFHHAIGKQTTQTDSSCTPLDAIYPVASLSKLMTATAIMLLVEDGLLSLHNPVVDFIPEFTGKNKEKVTLWHLLTHTMGGFSMASVDDLPLKTGLNPIDLPSTTNTINPLVHEFLNLGYTHPLSHEPGTTVIYSNYGYELLGEVIRRVSGANLESFTEERIFKPLQMNDTHFILPNHKRHRLVRRPNSAAYALADQYFFSGLEAENLFDTPWASAGLCSTATDMSLFGQMFLNGGCLNNIRILSPTTIRYMTRNHTPDFPDGDGNEKLCDAARGIGWDLPGTKNDLKYANLYSPSTYCHSGAGGALIWVDPEFQIVGVFLSVELSIREDLQRNWAGDRFANAITAAITEI